MDAAGADDDEQSVAGILGGEDIDSLVAAIQDGGFRGGGLGEFVLEEVGGYERVYAFDAPVFDLFLAAGVWVGVEELGGCELVAQWVEVVGSVLTDMVRAQRGEGTRRVNRYSLVSGYFVARCKDVSIAKCS